MTDALLALNAGSSSFKIALARADAPEAPLLRGGVERIGSAETELTIRGENTDLRLQLGEISHSASLAALFDVITERYQGFEVRAIAHRIVHGGSAFTNPEPITAEVLKALRALEPLAPLHQRPGLDAVEAARERFGGAVQIACFDTAFHASMPWENAAFALPRRFHDEGLRRYGFHGLACQSVVTILHGRGYPVASRKIAIAHLGNGCSVTAVEGGSSVATTMGFSALDGLTMGTRSGSIDPGALLHLMRQGYDADDLERLLYRESGLLGLSGLSNDMRDLCASNDPAARQAITHFIARAVQAIAQMAGAMGGLDAIAFSGGIGEHATDIRAAIVDGLAFLTGRDGTGLEVIVCPANEEIVLLKAAAALTGFSRAGG